MDMFFVLLAVATGIYLVLATVWDLKSREIYTFPCNLLTVLWIAYAFFRGNVEVKAMATYIVFFIGLYVAFNATKTWGAGDSDLLLLFGSVYLAHIDGAFSLMDISSQCIALVVVLLLSAGIGFVEAKIKKTDLRRDSSIAIAPGYAVVIIGIIIGGFIS